MATSHRQHGQGHHPLAGAILCFTSVAPERRTELSNICSQMGAAIKLDLTSDVTHLIVGDTNSAKYQYVAKAREDVRVLLPGWIHAVQKVWMSGDDVNVRQLEQEWRLPTFYGLKICLTGFDNPEQRKQIQEIINTNGAEYHGDLTKAVTHLVAAAPTGNKYEHAVNWRMKIVTWEWLQQSCERGMALNEACFHPTMAVEDRGKGAWDRRKSPSPVSGKRVRETEKREPIDPQRRKLRRSASNRLGSQSQSLWNEITAASFDRKPEEHDDWVEQDLSRPEGPEPPVAETEPTTGAVEARVDVQPRGVPASRAMGPFSDEHDGIFAGRVVYLRGFDKTKTNILREHLDSNGAVVICHAAELDNFTAEDLLRGFLVIPHDVEPDLTALPEAAGDLQMVTNWWVERCLHGKCLVNPAASVLCQPFGQFSINGFEDLTINSTGFTGIELLHVTKAITLFGATYDEMLSPKVSVLVCHSQQPNAEKSRFAASKQIPVVKAQWLWDCISDGETKPYDLYLLSPATAPPQPPKRRPQGSLNEVPTEPLPRPNNPKPQQKKAPVAKTARDVSRQPRTLELSVSSASPSTTEPNTTTNHSHLELGQDHGQDQDYVDHDAQPPAPYDGADSLPLQEVDPSVNTARRPSSANLATRSAKPSARANANANARTTPSPSNASASASAADLPHHLSSPSPQAEPEPAPEPSKPLPHPTTTASAPAPAPALPQDQDQDQDQEKDYSDILTRLLATRKTSAPAAAPSDPAPGLRRRRPLGRAQSTRSTISTTTTAADGAPSALSSASTTHPAEAAHEHEAEAEAQAQAEDTQLTSDDANAALLHLRPPQPSQQLGWDSPGAQRARERMIRAIGGTVVEERGLGLGWGERGVVKDAKEGLDGGVGIGRRRARRG